MDEEIYVSCHAPFLSLLLFETARSFHDQKGLLIGEVCTEVISKKTDENEVNCEHKTAIYLEHCIPLDDQDVIGPAGTINRSKLEKFTDALQNRIVGWYSFRRNTRLVPTTLSEMLIHQTLLELLPNAKCQYFVACFMTATAAANMSTHTFNHIFMTYDPYRAKFDSVRLKIYTLSDKSVNSNGYLMKSPSPTSRTFEKIINYLQKEENPVKSVLEIHKKISELLKHTDKKLQNSDNHRLQLEEEVEALRKRLGTKEKEHVLIEEPEPKELKVKTIRYDPNVKYGGGSGRTKAGVGSGLPTGDSSGGDEWPPRRWPDRSRSSSGTVGKVETKRPNYANIVAAAAAANNTCGGEELAFGSEKAAEKKVAAATAADSCANLQPAKSSMEY